MKRAILIFCTIVLLAAGLASCSTGQGVGKSGSAAAATPAAQENVIWASGKLVPTRWAALSPAVAGTVRAVHAAEGDQVAAGALLVELDNGVLQSQVEVAAAAVAEAEAARARLLAGATPAQLAAARAELAAAQAGVALAQANLKQAQEAAAAAVAQVAIAQAQYEELVSRPTPAEKVAAQKAVDQTQVAVDQAQAVYDTVRGDPHIAARPEALALQQATAALNAAKAAYAATTQGATKQQLAVARAQIEAAKAQAQVAQAQIPAAEANVQAALARVAGAQAALDGLTAGATAEDEAVAEARVKSAQAAQAAAQAQLRQTQVIAPFAGQIGAVYVRPGELATPGQPALVLGDTTQMRVETTDLRETDVARLKVGMAVEITFDALPGRTFQGSITRIAAMSSTEKGSTNYTVIIETPDLDPNLRWGMTAFVNIRVDK
jgi:HlyD family secretion protein